MSYPTKVQLIHRKKSADQYYINFPTAIAEAMDFSKGEVVEWVIHDRETMILQRPEAPPSPLDKKKTKTLTENVVEIISGQAEQGAEKGYQRELSEHMLAHLLCSHRHTVTGLLETLGREQLDWSKAYRLYQKHVDGATLFNPIIDGILELIPKDAPLVVAVDDSHLKKTGRHVAGAGWYKDPLGPAFHVNLMYAHRFIQLSAAIPDPTNPKRSRMIPIAVELIPKLPKPAKDATPRDLKYYEEIKAQNTPGAHARRLLRRLREHLDNAQCKNRCLWVCGDGHYSTSTLLPFLPSRTVYIGRTRNDISLRDVPESSGRRKAGRPKSYGEQLPTPEELRKDKSIPWKEHSIYNSSKTTRIRYKQIAAAKWQVTGEKAVVQVVVIAPLRYKKRKKGSWQYTKPAYLICTDAEIPITEMIQAYFWRWGIEVNFKEEKQLFGAGQAQVRTVSSVATAPTVCIATYAALLLAGIRTYGFQSAPPSIIPPKWYTHKKESHFTSSDLIKQFHRELMLVGSGNFSPFSFKNRINLNGEKLVFKNVI